MSELKIKDKTYDDTSFGVIHCHTDNSLKDSGVKVHDLVKRAVELGAPAITLTDHGTMMGIDDFMSECKAQNIKGIPGVEVYYQNDDMQKREHLILLATDYEGYIAIGKIVTKSNQRIDSGGFPRVNSDILEEVLKEYGQGHIIATSACVSGILASTILEPEALTEDLEKIEAKMMKVSNPKSPSYLKNLQMAEEIDKKLIWLVDRKRDLQKITKTPFKKKENMVEAAKKAGDVELYNERLANLTKEKEAVKMAEKELNQIASQIATTTRKKKDIKAQIDTAKKDHEKWEILNERRELIKSKVVSQPEAYKKTEEKAVYFQNLFGKDYFFMEMQFHGIDKEMRAMRALAQIAKKYDIPLLAANDVHTLTNGEEDLLQRQLMRSLRYNKWEERRIGDDQLYMKTNRELASALWKILDADQVNEAMANITRVVNMCNVEFSTDSHYPLFISDKEGETAEEAIVRLAREAVPKFFPGKLWTQEREDRLNYELGVINKMGYANYHLIVQDFLNFGRKLGRLSLDKIKYLKEHASEMNYHEFVDYVEQNMTEVALSIGPGRGSAAGSLVCYLLGITSIDPIKFDLLFERFLNVERVSMPKLLGV